LELACGYGKLTKVFGPVSIREVNGLRNVGIPALRDHQKAIAPGQGLFESRQEIFEQDDVAVRIADVVVSRNLLSASEHIIDVGQPGFVALDVGFMAETVFGADFSRAVFVAEEDDFHIRVQQRPTLQSVALDDTIVSAKRFAGSKERDHCLCFLNLYREGEWRLVNTKQPKA